MTIYKNRYLTIISKFNEEKSYIQIISTILILSYSFIIFGVALRPILKILKELYMN
jgi:hypothetical protein